jgi:hypothetical protein
MIGVTTRFRLKHSWALISRYLTYRRMQRDLTRSPGLRRYALLLQSPLACCTLSIWESKAALGTFTNVPRHVNAVRRAKHLFRDVWSAYWRLDAISEDASRWEGLGRGHRPALVAHAKYPWRLVERPQAAMAKRCASWL